MILNLKNFYIYCTIDFRWKDLEKRCIQELLNLTKINFLVKYFRKKLGCLTEYLIRLFWECVGYSLHSPVFSSFTRPEWLEKYHHCVRISEMVLFSSPYFSVFELNPEIYSVNHRIHPKFGKIRTRKTSNSRTSFNLFFTVKSTINFNITFTIQYF